QQVAVSRLQKAFAGGAAEGWRQNGGIRQRIEKMEKRTEAWRALQFDPCQPFSRFENTGEHVRNSVIVRYAEASQRARNQTRQRAAGRKNHPEPRTFLVRQIPNTLPWDCVGLFRCVSSNKNIEEPRRYHAAEHS